MNKLERIAEMEKQLSELKKQVEAELKAWPQTGDVVWWLSTEGQIDAERFDDSSYDPERLARGYFFKTEEEAKEADRKRVAEIAYKNKIKEVNGDWKPNWENAEAEKKFLYFTSYTPSEIVVSTQWSDKILDNEEYFTPYASNRQIEELKRLYAIWKTC